MYHLCLVIFVYFLSSSIWATSSLNCDSAIKKGSTKDRQDKKPNGAIPETEPTSTIVMADSHGFLPVWEVHQKILKNLPKGVNAILIRPPNISQAFDKKIQEMIDSHRLKFLEIPLADSWARDFLPETVRVGDELKLVDFKYSREVSEAASIAFAKEINLEIQQVPLNIQGGNILVDDKLTLYTTDRVLSENEQIPNVKTEDLQGEIKRILKEALGVKEVVIFPKLPGESTGHIDMYAKYVGKNIFVVGDSEISERKSVLDSVVGQLKARGYTVKRIRNARIGVSEEEGRVYSYINSLIANGTIYVPSFYDPNYSFTESAKSYDDEAKKVYEDLGFKVVMVPSYMLIELGGSIHCLTKQIPLT